MSGLSAVTKCADVLPTVAKNGGESFIKTLGSTLIRNILRFNTYGESRDFVITCRAFSGRRLVEKIADGTIRVDFCIRNAIIKYNLQRPIQSTDSFRFPKHSHIVLSSGKSVDVSGIRIDSSQAHLNGGWFDQTCIARAMDVIGSRGNIYNVPIFIFRHEYGIGTYTEFIATDGEIVELCYVRKMIREAIERKFTQIHCILDYRKESSSQTSLASIKIDALRKATLTFYDSFSRKGKPHKNLVPFFKSLLGESASLTGESPKVIRISDQGRSSGDGCYALYAALVLTHNEDKRLLDLSRHLILFDEKNDGLALRADLIVRLLLHDPLFKSNLFKQIPMEKLLRTQTKLITRLVSSLGTIQTITLPTPATQ